MKVSLTTLILAAGATVASPALANGVPNVNYNPATGNITIDTDGLTDLGSFTLLSTGGNFTGDTPDFSGLPAGVTDDVNSQIGWSQPFAVGVSGLFDLGNVMAANLTQLQFESDLAGSQYSAAIGGGGGGGDIDLNFVPEPSSLALLGLGGLLLARRRRG